jgi:hypothetical protein
MTGYSKASSATAIATSDSLNTAIGKLEKALDGKAAKATTLAGYGITDAYTTTQVDTEVAKKADKEHGTHVTEATVKSALGTGTGTSKYFREDGS